MQHVWLTLLAAGTTSDTPSVSLTDVGKLLGTLVSAGVAGIGLFAFIMGWIVPRSTHQEAQAQRDDWKAMYEHERDSHQATRDAMLLAAQRADAGIEAAQVAKMFLEAVRSRQSLPGRDTT